jgi:hypothetical protein
MKYPSISFFVRTGNVYISAFDDEGNHIEMRMNAERLKRVLLHPNHQLTHINWVDTPNYVERYNRDVKVCSEEFADLLQRHPSEVERLFKRCFLNILPELAGAEIKDVRIQVYHPSTQDTDAE